MDIANPNGRIFADGMFFSCSNVIGFALFHGKNHGDTDDGRTGYAGRNGNRDCN